MRAALLPTPGDPFMLRYWLRNYETWRQHVDELVVLVNGPLSSEVVQYDMRIVEEAGGRCLVMPERVGHDGAMRYLLENTEAGVIVMCEDDAYVRHPDAVGGGLDLVTRDPWAIVGSPRHEDYASSPRQVWGAYQPGDVEELRHGLWPAMLFAKRHDLLATDRQFGDRRWNVGERIRGWGMVTPEACKFVGIADDYIHLDTFFGTTFQLRATRMRVDMVHHVRLYDAPAVEQWIAEDPPWFHVTGLSTFDYVLNDRWDVTEIPLWPRRLAWWWRILRASTDIPLDLDAHLRAMHRFTEKWQIDVEEIRAWERRFDAWVNW